MGVYLTECASRECASVFATRAFTNLCRDWFNATDSKVGSSRILSERVLLVGDVQGALEKDEI